MEQPAVSVVIPCHDYAQYVGAAIESVLTQTLRDLEIIVIDDASTDGSWDVIQRYAARDGIRAYSEAENVGYVRAYRRGMALARGRALMPLDADDLALDRDALRLEFEMLDSDSRIGLVHSAYVEIDEAGRRRRERHPESTSGVMPAGIARRRLLFGNVIQHSGTLIRRSAYEEVGGYDQALSNPIDWDLWLRITARHALGYVDRPFFAYRVHSRNMHAEARNDPVRRALIERELLAVIDRATPGEAMLRSAARAETHALIAVASFASRRRLEGVRSLWRALREDARVTRRKRFLAALTWCVATLLPTPLYRSAARMARSRPTGP